MLKDTVWRRRRPPPRRPSAASLRRVQKRSRLKRRFHSRHHTGDAMIAIETAVQAEWAARGAFDACAAAEDDERPKFMVTFPSPFPTRGARATPVQREKVFPRLCVCVCVCVCRRYVTARSCPRARAARYLGRERERERDALSRERALLAGTRT